MKPRAIDQQQWLFLAPRSNETSRANFVATLATGYPREDVERHLNTEDLFTLGARKKFYIWGNAQGKKGSWNNMKIGDLVAFYAKKEFVYVGKCILKKHSPEIARELWGERSKKGDTWEFIYFLDELRPISISLEAMRDLGDYREKMIVQGFIPLKEEGMKNIIEQYGSLASFFDANTPGMRSKDFSLFNEIADKQQLKAEDIEGIDEATRAKDIGILIMQFEQRLSNEPPEIIEKKVKRVKRNITLVRKLKEQYKNECQICGFTFKQRNGDLYSEVAHIEPISSKKVGMDRPSNMLVLCANHHKMLDLGDLKFISVTQYELDGEIKDFLRPGFEGLTELSEDIFE